jgi:hypothetical protein
MPACRSRILPVATAPSADPAAEMAGSVHTGGGRFHATREGRTELVS